MKLTLNQNLLNENQDLLFTQKIEYENPKSFREELKKIDYEKTKAIIIIALKLDNKLPTMINDIKKKSIIVIGLGKDNKTTRFLLEKTNINYLLDPHTTQFVSKFDFIHHYNSGINHIFCNLAKERDIKFLFTLNFLRSNNIFQIVKNVGRINQNLKLARKYKIETAIDFLVNEDFENKSKIEQIGILSFFNLSTLQKVQAVNSIRLTYNENLFKNSHSFINKYIEVID